MEGFVVYGNAEENNVQSCDVSLNSCKGRGQNRIGRRNRSTLERIPSTEAEP